jgi:hypothetical protein
VCCTLRRFDIIILQIFWCAAPFVEEERQMEHYDLTEAPEYRILNDSDFFSTA